jgi:4-hydroxy-tetrahydrodipicolinate synthase
MAATQLPKGLIIDMITPLLGDGSIDSAGLERHIMGMLPYAQAILIAGPCMGEGEDLSPEQREELFYKTLVIVQSRLPLLVWITRRTIEETQNTLLLLKKRQKDLDYAGPVFWADTPLYYHSNRGLQGHYEKLYSMAEGSFVLINDPEFIRRKEQPLKRLNIRTSILKEVASLDAVKGLIYSGSLDRSYNYRKATRLRQDFMIYDGDESHFLEHPSLNGVLSRGANLAPAAWKTVISSSLNIYGNLEEYPDRMRQILDSGRYVNGLRHIYRGYGPGFIKQVLSNSGVIEGVTPPLDSGKIAGDIRKVLRLMEEHHNRSSFKS